MSDNSVTDKTVIPFVCALSSNSAAPDIELGVATADGGIVWVGYAYIPLAWDDADSVAFHLYVDVAGYKAPSWPLQHPCDLSMALCSWAIMGGALDERRLEKAREKQGTFTPFNPRTCGGFPWDKFKKRFERSQS